MAFDDEMEMTGENDGGDMKIGGKKRKKVSASGKPSKVKAKKSSGKKSYKQVSGK